MFRNRLGFILISLTLLLLVMRVILTTATASAAAANSLLVSSRVAQRESVPAGDYEWLEAGRSMTEQTTNWSGYAIQASDGAVAKVQGSWIVPTVTCSGGTENSSAWVGMGGHGSTTIVQAGTEQDCRGKTAHYFAWYEMYPADLVILSLPVHGGDQIQTKITYVGNQQFAFELTNLSTGDTFLTTQTSGHAQRSSAEWIVEAPGGLPLADFGTVRFADSQATISGIAGTIGSFTRYTSINMVALSGAVRTQTFGLSKGGANFTVVWYRP